MKNVNILFCLLVLFILACKSNNAGKTEKFQKHRDNTINIEDEIIDIETKILFGESSLYIINDILIVSEIRPTNKGIHLFNKNTFKYITSTGIIGKGPGEIARPGRIGVDRMNKVFWVQDHGKMIMWEFPIDSVLNNKNYKPTKKIDLHNDLFLERFGFLNDSIALGKAVRVLSNSSFDMTMAKLNLNSNVTEKYGYEHPKAIGKMSNSKFKLSLANNIYVNCYSSLDLITICDLDGNLKYNVYGPEWLNNKDNKKNYFSEVNFINNHIIASYLGDVAIFFDKYKRPRGNRPTKFLVFDLNGNYEKTIETGYKIQLFCVDEEKNRVIVYFDGRENPLGYFNLNFD